MCGCGGFPKGKKARFLPGHDARHYSALKRAAADKAAAREAAKLSWLLPDRRRRSHDSSSRQGGRPRAGGGLRPLVGAVLQALNETRKATPTSQTRHRRPSLGRGCQTVRRSASIQTVAAICRVTRPTDPPISRCWPSPGRGGCWGLPPSRTADSTAMRRTLSPCTAKPRSETCRCSPAAPRPKSSVHGGRRAVVWAASSRFGALPQPARGAHGEPRHVETFEAGRHRGMSPWGYRTARDDGGRVIYQTPARRRAGAGRSRPPGVRVVGPSAPLRGRRCDGAGGCASSDGGGLEQVGRS